MVSKELGISEADCKALDFMQKLGFDFARFPLDYRLWTKGTDYFNPIESVFSRPYQYFKECEKRKIHFCLNLHRAPGYCINRNDLETHNLWLDPLAQNAFVFLWERYARLFKGIPGDLVSFDLLNEPPEIGQYGMNRENHAALIRRTAEAIWSIDPDRPLMIDGLAGGNIAMPELADLDVIMSTRGYQPMALTHLFADWCKETQGIKTASYPGTAWNGKNWNQATLREHYRPWLKLASQGVNIFIGEFGCYNRVANHQALRWFEDLLSLFAEWQWGYALWEFKGPFGIIEHGRPNTICTEIDGYMVDKALLELLLSHRVNRRSS